MTYITKGEQFWNEDHTEGYEITQDIEAHDPVPASQFMALGAAMKPENGLEMPKWLQGILQSPGGVEAYRSKAKEHNNIKEG